MGAILITPNGDCTKIVPKNGTDFKIEELHKYIDGHIEVLYRIDNRKLMILDESGKIKNKEFNGDATLLARIDYNIAPDDYIAGTVIICDIEMVH